MNRKDLDALNELYLSVYDEEQLNEAPGQEAQGVRKAIQSGKSIGLAGNNFRQNVGSLKLNSAETKKSGRSTLAITPKSDGGFDANEIDKAAVYGNKRTIGGETYYRARLKNKDVFVSRAPKDSRLDSPTAGTGPEENKVGSPVKLIPTSIPTSQQRQGTGGGGAPPRPAAASGPVLSKKDGVEGTGVGADFKERAFTAAEKSRYASVAARNSASSATPTKPIPSNASSATASTADKIKGGMNVYNKQMADKDVKGATETGKNISSLKFGSPEDRKAKTIGTRNPLMDKTFGYQTGNSPKDQQARADNIVKSGAVAALKPATPTPARNGFGVSAAPIVANSSASSATAPPTPGQNSINNKKPITPVNSSYEWPSAKTIRDIAGAYASIYEAKKKVDQDQDGDNDFADVRVARMIASGVPKAKAIAMVKDKSYNEEVELWVNELLEEGYDLSEYTWEDMFEIYEATAMAKRGYDETEIRNKIAKSTGGGEAADRATALENQPTYGNKSKKAAREKLARTQRGDFRRTTSSNPGLHGYAYKSNDPAVKAKQAARGAQRGVLTPNEKKELNREAYETYEFVASYLLENNFANTVEDANVIINNMSENWFESIVEEKKPLPVSKMKKKESKLLDNEEGHLQALRTDVGSKERKARMKELQRFDNINSVRTSVAKRGGKQQHSMPEIGRYKPKDED